MDALKERGIYEDTMVIYGSDHGCHFRTHADEVAEGGYDDYKRNSFEGTIHVPLLIKGAEFEKGKREEKVVSLLDLPKTILSAAGFDTELLGLQGRPLFEACNPDWEEAVYIQISESFVGRALRTNRYKYVVHAPDRDPWKESESPVYKEKYLFDLVNDPLEKVNLVDDRAYEEIKNALKERLVSFGEEAGEAFIVEC